jgi:hypothetical protein
LLLPEHHPRPSLVHVALVDALRGSLVRLTTTTFPFEILATPLAFSQHFAAAANLKKVCDST